MVGFHALKRMYPFAAMVGQEPAQKAALLNLISPRIGGMLLTGKQGSGKSTLVRSLGRLLPGTRFFNVPIGISEERLLGGLDWEASVKLGERVFSPGILAEAHGQILHLDDVNRMDGRTVSTILNALESGWVRFEREGLSRCYPTSFFLFASMNPAEGMLEPQILDRFGLSTSMASIADLTHRGEIAGRSLAWDKGSDDLEMQWQQEEKVLNSRLEEARSNTSKVHFPERLLEMATRLAAANGCQGHRGEITLCRAAMALAAWHRREIVIETDVEEAAVYTLEHRASTQADVGRSEKPSDSPLAGQEDSKEGAEYRKPGALPPRRAPPFGEREHPSPWAATDQEIDRKSDPSKKPGEWIPGIVGGYKSPELMPLRTYSRKPGSEGGRRNEAMSLVRYGLARGPTVPAESPHGIAWDATLKQALSRQAGRSNGNLVVSIHPEDLRRKEPKGKAGRILLFLVDASGSMGVRRRMEAAKGSILETLKQAYLRRDRVAMMVFRRRECSLLLPLTRSPQRAERLLREIPTGGETPLGLGLREASELCGKLRSKEPSVPIHLVLFSDGRVNVSLTGKNPLEEVLDICKELATKKISCTVVDTETGFVRLALAHKVAMHMNARYCRLDDLEDKG